MIKRRTAPTTVLLLALAALLILLSVVFRQTLGGLLWRALGPVVGTRDAWSAGEVAQLRSQLASTSAALADYDRLAAQNKELRAELGRATPGHMILAGILMHPPGTPYDTLVLDAGSAQGVAMGASVFAGTVGIGIIDEVYANTSRVVLYSAPGQSYQAVLTVQDKTLPAVVDGQGAGSLSARVPAGTAVEVGDTVALPGIDGGMVGVVSGVSGGDSDTFKTVYLRLPVNLFELQYVYIKP